MVLGIPLPWAISVMSPDNAVVFTSTIEQPITSTLMMLVVWYFRDQWPVPYRRFAVWAVLALTSANVLLVVTGRTGQMALLLAWVFILVGVLPRRYRWSVLLLPALVALGVGLGSERMQQRWLKASSDVMALQQGPLKEENSLGFRIDAWQKSVQAVAEKPIVGHGVGAWSQAYVAQGGTIPKATDPHQQFLLWAVECGGVGVALFVGFLALLWRNAQNLPWSARWGLRSVLAIASTPRSATRRRRISASISFFMRSIRDSNSSRSSRSSSCVNGAGLCSCASSIKRSRTPSRSRFRSVR
jgi:O-antigen ligase